jgi:hypothetical protein
VYGDGTVIAAATDNMEGDLVTYEVHPDAIPEGAEVVGFTDDGNAIVAQQARYDETAVLNGKDRPGCRTPLSRSSTSKFRTGTSRSGSS